MASTNSGYVFDPEEDFSPSLVECQPSWTAAQSDVMRQPQWQPQTTFEELLQAESNPVDDVPFSLPSSASLLHQPTRSHGPIEYVMHPDKVASQAEVEPLEDHTAPPITQHRAREACLACRKAKQRCYGVESSRSGVCRRCSMHGRFCSFQPQSEANTQRRKSRKACLECGKAKIRCSRVEGLDACESCSILGKFCSIKPRKPYTRKSKRNVAKQKFMPTSSEVTSALYSHITACDFCKTEEDRCQNIGRHQCDNCKKHGQRCLFTVQFQFEEDAGSGPNSVAMILMED